MPDPAPPEDPVAPKSEELACGAEGVALWELSAKLCDGCGGLKVIASWYRSTRLSLLIFGVEAEDSPASWSRYRGSRISGSLSPLA